jgi:DNA-binding beta-propeller fold protein YncE
MKAFLPAPTWGSAPNPAGTPRTRRSRLPGALLVSVAALLGGCESCKDRQQIPMMIDSGAKPVVVVDAGYAPVKANATLLTTWGASNGLKDPSTVLYDPGIDVYYVANMHGKRLEADDNGFISHFSPSAMGGNLKWIEGGTKSFKLNAPAGMAVAGDLLFVSDIDTVRFFDRRTGGTKGEVVITGARSLGEILVLEDGRVLVTDQGMKEDGTLDPTSESAVYVVAPDKTFSTLLKVPDLKNLSALAVLDKMIWGAGASSNVVFPLNKGENDPKKLEKGKDFNLPAGKLHGLIASPAGELWATSWEKGAVYRGRPNGLFQPAIENLKGPSGLTYDAKRDRVVVACTDANEVRSYELR